MKRTLAISLIALGLAACQQQAKVPEAAPSAEGTAKVGAPAAALAVTGGTLVLPAVKGNPGAAYFDLANGTAKPATLAAVTIAGAEKAEMHQTTGGSMAPVDTVEVKAGETVKFERGGRHVMIFGLADSVQAGGSAEMTLTFADGQKITAPLTAQAAGGGMEGMDHGSMR